MARRLISKLGNKWNPVKCTPYKDNLDHRRLISKLGNKWNPVKCTPYKDNLDHMPGRKRANEKVGKEPVLYNPNITERGNPEKAIRIFLGKLKDGEGDYKPITRKH